MNIRKSRWTKRAIKASLIFTLAFGVTYLTLDKGETNED